MKMFMTVLAALTLSAGIAAAENAAGGCDYGQTNAGTTEAPVVPADQADV